MARRLLLSLVAITLVGIAQTANATLLSYYAYLNGPSEAPANASPGLGYALVEYDDVAQTLHVNASFSGLLAGVTAAHIHAATAVPFAGTASVATTTPTFAGFPSGVTSGNYDNTLDLTQASSFRAGFITASGGTVAGAEAALTSALANGTSYFNIHTTAFTGGEIRGFLQPVPEPATMITLCVGLAGIAGRAVRRRKSSLSE